MPPLLKINGRDLSEYVVVDDDALDLDPEHESPQFSGSVALREGQRGSEPTVENREWILPLLLSAADRPGLHALVRAINGDLVRGAEVQWATDAADPATYFTLEVGRLDVAYQFFLSVHATAKATLFLWTAPRGSTGTHRMVASHRASGPLSFPATGILGDRAALANLEVGVGSQIASAGRVVGFAVHNHPSHNPLHAFTTGASQIALLASSTILGATNAIASRLAAIPVSPTSADLALRSYLTPPDAHVGRHRVLGWVRSRLSVPVRITARDRFGGVLGPTVLASQLDANKLQLVDFGEIQVPARASGQEPVPTQFVDLIAGGASGASVVASPGFHVAGLVYLNLDRSPGLLRTGGVNAGASVLSDNFEGGGRFYGGPDVLLSAYPQAEGGLWSKAESGDFRFHFAGLVAAYGATLTLHTLASGLPYTDVQSDITFQLDQGGFGVNPPSAIASGGILEWWPKVAGATRSVRARLQTGPSAAIALSLHSHDGSATTLHASVGLGASAASAIFGGQAMKLTTQIVGGRADIWLATGPLASPLISASHAAFTLPGNPAMRSRNTGSAGAAVSANGLAIRSISARPLVGSVGPGGARAIFRFESSPEERAIEANASVFASDQTAAFRGRSPRLPPVGSPGASGPARVVVFAGEVDNFSLTDVLDVNLTALERFSFLR